MSNCKISALILCTMLLLCLGTKIKAGAAGPPTEDNAILTEQYWNYNDPDPEVGGPFNDESFKDIKGALKAPRKGGAAGAGLFLPNYIGFVGHGPASGSGSSLLSVSQRPPGCRAGLCSGSCAATCLVGNPGSCGGNCKGLCKGNCMGDCSAPKDQSGSSSGGTTSSNPNAGMSTPNSGPPTEWPEHDPPIFMHWLNAAGSQFGKSMQNELNGGPAKSKLLHAPTGIAQDQGASHQGQKEQTSPGQTNAQSKANQNGGKEQAADNLALVERYHAAAAMAMIRNYLENFTTDGGNQWNSMRNRVFMPMAILILLVGAVAQQGVAMVVGGVPLVKLEQTADGPWEGIMRSIIAIFLIPASYLVVNYGIDVANSMLYEIDYTYTQLFGGSMYDEAFSGHIRAFPCREPEENPGLVENDKHSRMFNYFGSGPMARLEGYVFGVKYDDPLKGIYIVPEDRNNDIVPYYVNEERQGINQANAAMTIAWVILVCCQQAFLYYLFFVGPVMAALYVFPQQQLRGAWMLWLEGVVSVCCWSLFWGTCIVIQALIHKFGDNMFDTGTMIFTACNVLTIGCVKFAFDIGGLTKDVAGECARIGMSVVQHVGEHAGKGSPGPGPGPGPGLLMGANMMAGQAKAMGGGGGSLRGLGGGPGPGKSLIGGASGGKGIGGGLLGAAAKGTGNMPGSSSPPLVGAKGTGGGGGSLLGAAAYRAAAKGGLSGIKPPPKAAGDDAALVAARKSRYGSLGIYSAIMKNPNGLARSFSGSGTGSYKPGKAGVAGRDGASGASYIAARRLGRGSVATTGGAAFAGSAFKATHVGGATPAYRSMMGSIASTVPGNRRNAAATMLKRDAGARHALQNRPMSEADRSKRQNAFNQRLSGQTARLYGGAVPPAVAAAQRNLFGQRGGKTISNVDSVNHSIDRSFKQAPLGRSVPMAAARSSAQAPSMSGRRMFNQALTGQIARDLTGLNSKGVPIAKNPQQPGSTRSAGMRKEAIMPSAAQPIRPAANRGTAPAGPKPNGPTIGQQISKQAQDRVHLHGDNITKKWAKEQAPQAPGERGSGSLMPSATAKPQPAQPVKGSSQTPPPVRRLAAASGSASAMPTPKVQKPKTDVTGEVHKTVDALMPLNRKGQPTANKQPAAPQSHVVAPSRGKQSYSSNAAVPAKSAPANAAPPSGPPATSGGTGAAIRRAPGARSGDYIQTRPAQKIAKESFRRFGVREQNITTQWAKEHAHNAPGTRGQGSLITGGTAKPSAPPSVKGSSPAPSSPLRKASSPAPSTGTGKTQVGTVKAASLAQLYKHLNSTIDTVTKLDAKGTPIDKQKSQRPTIPTPPSSSGIPAGAIKSSSVFGRVLKDALPPKSGSKEKKDGK